MFSCITNSNNDGSVAAVRRFIARCINNRFGRVVLSGK